MITALTLISIGTFSGPVHVVQHLVQTEGIIRGALYWNQIDFLVVCHAYIEIIRFNKNGPLLRNYLAISGGMVDILGKCSFTHVGSK